MSRRPKPSSVFGKYPAFSKNKDSLELLCGALRPIIDGKVKPDQLKMLLDIKSRAWKNEHHKPVSVLTKTAGCDARFRNRRRCARNRCDDGINRRADRTNWSSRRGGAGRHILGILISYGFLNPLAVNIELSARRTTRLFADASPLPWSVSPMAWLRSWRSKWPAAVGKRSASERDELEALLKRRRQVAWQKNTAHHGGAWKVAYADFVTAMMALSSSFGLPRRTKKSKKRSNAPSAILSLPITEESTGVIPNKDSQSAVSSKGNFDSASAVELNMLARFPRPAQSVPANQETDDETIKMEMSPKVCA
jgi:hypothetical protein